MRWISVFRTHFEQQKAILYLVSFSWFMCSGKYTSRIKVYLWLLENIESVFYLLIKKYIKKKNLF